MILDKVECLDWCFESLIENIVRGKVAEFIVFSALGGDGDVVRSQWEYADLTFGDMKSIGLARLEDRSAAVSFADLRGTVLRQLGPTWRPQAHHQVLQQSLSRERLPGRWRGLRAASRSP